MWPLMSNVGDVANVRLWDLRQARDQSPAPHTSVLAVHLCWSGLSPSGSTHHEDRLRTQPESALLIAESTQHPVAMRWLLLLNRHDGDRKTSRGRHSKGDGIEICEGHDLAPLLDRSPSKAPVTYH